MEASREGHLDMVALLLEHGKSTFFFFFFFFFSQPFLFSICYLAHTSALVESGCQVDCMHNKNLVLSNELIKVELPL